MVYYIVFACPKCGYIRYAREGQKTAKCLRCGYQIQISIRKIRVLARVRDVRKAVELVKLYKVKGR